MKVIEMKIKPVNKTVALFNCGSSVSGVIHTENHETTVIIGGDHVLEKFHCPVCAINSITDLEINIAESNKAFGMDYQQYKKSISASLFSVTH
ncbi:DNA breaking-rejoining protein [Pectobacterium brasiliense]|uniref:DNA breaking-rejoining protein n=1 Tax=Pectobacterium brasiliense TaxID=180957 RepID=UPI003986A100